MARQVLLFLLIAFLNVSVILCREDHQQHISDSFSHHHRRSTPEDSVVSTKDPLSVTEGDGKPLGEIQHDLRIHQISYTMPAVISPVTSIIIVSVVLGCLIIPICIAVTFFCAKKYCRKRRQGIILYRPFVNSSGMQQQREPAVKTETQRPTHNIEGIGLQNTSPQHMTQPTYSIQGIQFQNVSLEHMTQPTHSIQGIELQNVSPKHMTQPTQQV